MSSNTRQTRSNSAGRRAGEGQVGQQARAEEAVPHVVARDQERRVGMSAAIAASTADFRAAADSVAAAVVASAGPRAGAGIAEQSGDRALSENEFREGTPTDQAEMEALGGSTTLNSDASTMIAASLSPVSVHEGRGYDRAKVERQVMQYWRDEEDRELAGTSRSHAARGAVETGPILEAAGAQAAGDVGEDCKGKQKVGQAGVSHHRLTEEQDRLGQEELDQEPTYAQAESGHGATEQLFRGQMHVKEMQRRQREERRRQYDEQLARERRAREMHQAAWSEAENLRLNAETLREHYQYLMEASSYVLAEMHKEATEAQRAEQWRRWGEVKTALDDVHRRMRWNDTLVARAKSFQAVSDLAMRPEPAGALYFDTDDMDTSS
ncbi:hypothetical protein CPC16_005359 [Podila verticillata]|nr:hypothetical protein CPC16_005359 [Podila verticillata]